MITDKELFDRQYATIQEQKSEIERLRTFQQALRDECAKLRAELQHEKTLHKNTKEYCSYERIVGLEAERGQLRAELAKVGPWDADLSKERDQLRQALREAREAFDAILDDDEDAECLDPEDLLYNVCQIAKRAKAKLAQVVPDGGEE